MKRIKTNKTNLIILLTFATILTVSCLPRTVNTYSEELRTSELTPMSSQIMPRTIRVAIYNEPNTTQPGYTSVGNLHNNYTALQNLLTDAGYLVSELTTTDISNHKLMTADYDVFIMADNLPRENITNYVKEYWLGGGGILSLDSAISYICYAGMIPPESVGSDGYTVYWSYSPFSTVQNITTRHPVTKAYQVNDTMTEKNIDWAAFDWTALQGTSISSEVTKLATKVVNSNLATVVSFEPTLGGGRVIQMLGDGSTIGTNMDEIIIDAIDWLCPRPKGRILFDLSHQPVYGVDDWDEPDYATWGERFYLWRDNLVNRSYTFDKLYPSATGNLTSNNLAPYDMLILCSPTINYTANEISSVMNWVNNGGGLFILGGYYDDNSQRINDLLSSTGLNVNLTIDGTVGIVDYKVEHPTVEGSTQLECPVLPGLINYTDNAFPIWGQSSNEIIIGGQEYGNGRIILSGDLFFLRFNYIVLEDNLQFSINAANWLTSADAEILIYVVDHSNPDANDNVYKGPVATALNDLGLSYYLTFSIKYFNMSLTEGSYDLAIMDHQLVGINAYFGDILNYMISGGHLILNTWAYRNSAGYALWDYLGFEYGGNYYTTPQDIYIWNSAHPIFNSPAPYNANTLNTTYNWATTDYSNLTLHNNATAIAGLTPTAQESSAAIILGAEGRAIINAMHLTEYYDDTDDSTYPDALEIWENEIAYMLKPGGFSLSSDADIPDDDGMFNLTWTVSSDATEYNIYQHTSFITELTGAETLIAGGVNANSHPLTGLTNGTYYFIIESTNDYGIELSNCIEITVAIPPTPPEPEPEPGGGPGDNFIIIIIIVISIIAGVAIVTVVLLLRRRKA